ncbi:MAG: IPT/TIG domain-containing protein [Anaerolineales bacterium]
MKLISSRIIPLALLIVIVSAPFTVPVSAQTPPTVTDVTPSTIVNNVSNNIVIRGTGFDGTTTATFGGANLPLSNITATSFSATIPSGTPANTYTIEVFVASVSVGTVSVTVNDPPPPPTATFTPSPTATLPFVRPQFVVRSSKPSGNIKSGNEIKLNIVMENAGTSTAYSTQAVFTSADLIPTKTGGVSAVGKVGADDEVGFGQSFYVSAQFAGKTILVVDLTVTYYDDAGTSFTDKFTLSIPVNGSTSSGGSGVAAATATPTGVRASQLVITNYSASVDPLQPGNQFALKMTVQNVGNAKAQRVTMIVGGGSSGGSDGGTPQPGGVSGGSGEFTNFAPVGASNVQSLGDFPVGAKMEASQNLIVNVSTIPGAYPMKISFSYLNDKNEVINDEQVITLLVYGLPSVDVSFYRPPDPFTVGQGGALPIQVVNLGKRQAVLGNIKITSDAGMIDNGAGLVGALDPGGYFTIDSFITPEQSGKVKLDVVIEYVDDFNQPRTIEKTLEVDVAEGFIEPTPDPSIDNGGGGGGEGFMPVDQETIMHKIFRFIKGLFGLDSAWPVWQPPSGGGGVEEPSDTKPIISPAGKG